MEWLLVAFVLLLLPAAFFIVALLAFMLARGFYLSWLIFASGVPLPYWRQAAPEKCSYCRRIVNQPCPKRSACIYGGLHAE